MEIRSNSNAEYYFSILKKYSQLSEDVISTILQFVLWGLQSGDLIDVFNSERKKWESVIFLENYSFSDNTTLPYTYVIEQQKYKFVYGPQYSRPFTNTPCRWSHLHNIPPIIKTLKSFLYVNIDDKKIKKIQVFNYTHDKNTFVLECSRDDPTRPAYKMYYKYGVSIIFKDVTYIFISLYSWAQYNEDGIIDENTLQRTE